ncbi:unnamed protein product [Mycena citricolor]|uniref:ZZ-type domain-containing protein n=1 Tax=Mycena citricolor TaxID=2018698 RepID=A0AAD2HYX6_9AGAR|nr:unnamed protein product [Mycena citricolor]CAK5285012.1 unnamed protein product [Mycena citricolor]
MPRASVSSSASQPAGAPPTNFLCDACQVSIPGTAPRAHCLICPDHDLCAACTLGERFVGAHTAAHAMEVYRICGDSAIGVVRGNWVLAYTAAQPLHTSASSPTSGIGEIDAGGTMSPGADTSPDSASSSATRISTSTASAAPPTGLNGWGPFFSPADLSHTRIYAELIMAIFEHLDTARSGYLPPEGYSRMIDDMQYPLHINIWKKNLTQSSFLQSREAAADAALRAAYDTFGLEYITQSRPRAKSSGRFSGLQSLASPATPMPLLTARGLGNVIAIELLSNPNDAFPRLARAVQAYGLYSKEPYASWGAMPRRVLPASPDPRMLARVQQAQMSAVQTATMNAQLTAQADLAAVNILSDSQWERRRY